MSTARARSELSWEPRISGIEAIEEFLDGLRSREGGPTEPLAAHSGGPWRSQEFTTGLGTAP